jgi:hypothetical protein
VAKKKFMNSLFGKTTVDEMFVDKRETSKNDCRVMLKLDLKMGEVSKMLFF